MKSDQVEKIRMLVDGDDILGLINMDEAEVSFGVVEIPGLNKITPVSNGVKTIPQIPGTVKIPRDSNSLKFFEDWFEKRETHEVTIIRTDGSGKEIQRQLWPNTELSRFNGPAYDASAPVTAAQNVTFLPEDIIYIAAEG
jgi:hypothetical protein